MNNKIYTIEEIKDKSKNIFSKCDYIKKAYLFGSYAKQKADKNSDIDFIVCLNMPVGMKIYSLYDEINQEFGKETDILTENEIKKIMPKVYEQEKVLIYEQ